MGIWTPHDDEPLTCANCAGIILHADYVLSNGLPYCNNECRRQGVCAHCGGTLTDDWRQGWGGNKGTNDAPYYCTAECYNAAGIEQAKAERAGEWVSL